MITSRKSNLHHFMILFMGQTVSQLGTGMTGFALVIWAYTRNGEVMASSLLAVCSAVPYLLVSLFGGAVADHANKKTIMLVCDSVSAVGSLVLLLCFYGNALQLWLLCAVNALSGLMSAFQNPASQVAVSLLIDKKDYARIAGVQSFFASLTGLLTPVLATALLSTGGLSLILAIDLGTFFFAFLTLLLFVRIPERIVREKSASVREILTSVREGLCFMRSRPGILGLLLMYSVLEFAGAVSFDSMYAPLLLARTQNNEMIVGVVSALMALGCVAASLMLFLMRQPKRKLPMMYLGSFLCLAGITAFGMGRNLWQWCGIALLGCFGSPIYQTYQTVILREKVGVAMQGRVFSLQGMIVKMLAPAGYLAGAALADSVFEPFMAHDGRVQDIASIFVGKGHGAGIGLVFVLAGVFGMAFLCLLSRKKSIRRLDEAD